MEEYDQPNGESNVNKQIPQIALVTGGNRGIGMEIARQLSLKGFKVLIGCRDEDKGKKTIEQMRKGGVAFELEVVDVNSRNSIDELMKRVKKKYGRLDVLVNNAGIILDRGIFILDVTESATKETFETNYFGVLNLIQAAVPLMKKHHYGRIVNVSSGIGSFQVHQGLLGLNLNSCPACRCFLFEVIQILILITKGIHNIRMNQQKGHRNDNGIDSLKKSI